MAEKHKRDSRADPAELAAKEQEVSDGIATLLTLSDGTYRMTELRLGEPNKRYWEVDESGGIVWKAHRETVNIPDGVSVMVVDH